MAVRPRDPLYDAWVETWGEPQTKTERGRLNKALKELREIGATPEQIRTVLRRYEREFAGCTPSPQGVTGNWSFLLAYGGHDSKSEALCAHGVSFFERCERCLEEA